MSVYESGNRAAVKKQVELPWKKAVEFAFTSIRIRFARSLITAGGVCLGIAFLSSVLISKGIAGSAAKPGDIARLNWLVGLSLLVCAVGITNSMLMSVTERFREIGTMKCLGALDQFVVKIFMIEAVTMGAIASLLGWFAGTVLILLAKVIAGVPKDAPVGTTWHGALSFGDVAGSFVFCLLIGSVLTAIATFFPAKSAASIPPAAALRSDI